MHANEGSALPLKEKEKKDNFFFAEIEVSLSFLGKKMAKKSFMKDRKGFGSAPCYTIEVRN